MRLIIEARPEGGEERATDATIVAVVERKDRSLADLGLTLAEGRAPLAEVQSFLVKRTGNLGDGFAGATLPSAFQRVAHSSGLPLRPVGYCQSAQVGVGD